MRQNILTVPLFLIAELPLVGCPGPDPLGPHTRSRPQLESDSLEGLSASWGVGPFELKYDFASGNVTLGVGAQVATPVGVFKVGYEKQVSEVAAAKVTLKVIDPEGKVWLYDVNVQSRALAVEDGMVVPQPDGTVCIDLRGIPRGATNHSCVCRFAQEVLDSSEHGMAGADDAADPYAECVAARTQKRMDSLPEGKRAQLLALERDLIAFEDNFAALSFCGGTGEVHFPAQRRAFREDFMRHLVDITEYGATSGPAGTTREVDRMVQEVISDRSEEDCYEYAPRVQELRQSWRDLQTTLAATEPHVSGATLRELQAIF